MFRSWQHRHISAARALILIALLAVAGGNLLEAGHSHAPHEVTADCLLLHVSANAVSDGIHADVPDYRNPTPILSHVAAPRSRVIVQLPPPRGPPAHS
ncbi:MAG: hypothetical protein U5K56_20375 [Halioglobus sp.]|nr:hypothetical protein [Halioglobus sp.]